MLADLAAVREAARAEEATLRWRVAGLAAMQHKTALERATEESLEAEATHVWAGRAARADALHAFLSRAGSRGGVRPWLTRQPAMLLQMASNTAPSAAAVQAAEIAEHNRSIIGKDADGTTGASVAGASAGTGIGADADEASGKGSAKGSKKGSKKKVNPGTSAAAVAAADAADEALGWWAKLQKQAHVASDAIEMSQKASIAAVDIASMAACEPRLARMVVLALTPAARLALAPSVTAVAAAAAAARPDPPIISELCTSQMHDWDRRRERLRQRQRVTHSAGAASAAEGWWQPTLAAPCHVSSAGAELLLWRSDNGKPRCLSRGAALWLRLSGNATNGEGGGARGNEANPMVAWTGETSLRRWAPPKAIAEVQLEEEAEPLQARRRSMAVDDISESETWAAIASHVSGAAEAARLAAEEAEAMAKVKAQADAAVSLKADPGKARRTMRATMIAGIVASSMGPGATIAETVQRASGSPEPTATAAAEPAEAVLTGRSDVSKACNASPTVEETGSMLSMEAVGELLSEVLECIAGLVLAVEQMARAAGSDGAGGGDTPATPAAGAAGGAAAQKTVTPAHSKMQLKTVGKFALLGRRKGNSEEMADTRRGEVQLTPVAKAAQADAEYEESLAALVPEDGNCAFAAFREEDLSRPAAAEEEEGKGGEVTEAGSRGGEPLQLCGHTAKVTALATTRCGRLVVSGSADSTVRVWSVRTGVCAAVLRGHLGAISCIACVEAGEDGSDNEAFRIVSGSVDARVVVWTLRHAVELLWRRSPLVWRCSVGEEAAEGAVEGGSIMQRSAVVLSGHTHAVTQLRVAQSGEWYAALLRLHSCVPALCALLACQDRRHSHQPPRLLFSRTMLLLPSPHIGASAVRVRCTAPASSKCGPYRTA